MAAGSRKKSGAQHPVSSGNFECGVHGALTFNFAGTSNRLKIDIPRKLYKQANKGNLNPLKGIECCFIYEILKL